MSEQEFELYLTLLARLLRLKPEQRAEIADELRDHLTARLEELSAAGLSHDQAIRQALDELGDAASMADHFTRISRIRQRRLIMRCTVGTLIATMAIAVATALYWPVAPTTLPLHSRSVAHAQQEGVARELPDRTEAERDQATKDRLRQTRIKPEFVQTPLDDVLEFLSDLTTVDILVDRRLVVDEALDLPKTEVDLSLQHGDLSVAMVLDLVLRHHLGPAVTYTIRDGVVYITAADQGHERRVYNCADFEGLKEKNNADPLITAIEKVIEPNSWAGMGGNGAIVRLDHLLVVNQTPEVHRQIDALLNMLREAMLSDAAGPPRGIAPIGQPPSDN